MGTLPKVPFKSARTELALEVMLSICLDQDKFSNSQVFGVHDLSNITVVNLVSGI